MTFDEILEQALEMLQRRGRVSYRALKVQFQLDDALLELLRDEIVEVHQLARDQEGKMLVWRGDPATASALVSPPAPDPAQTPLTYTPPHLTNKILAASSVLAGERKQVTVVFADLKGSLELLADRDPEEARQLLDPVLERMMAAVHRYEGTVNQIMGDGIMALFGAPIAHEDHAVRACYAALAMQAALRRYSDEVRRTHGLAVHCRIGLNSGEVVVRAIRNDLHMDYSAIGPIVHLAARMEQLATPGSILLTAATLRLVEGLVRVHALGPIPVKGLADPVEIYELVGASAFRDRFQVRVAGGLTPFVGRDTELVALGQALKHAGTGHGQVVALSGEAGVGKSRLIYECVQAHQTQGWRVLESAAVSYGKATPYFPVIDLLRRYAHIEEHDAPCTIRAKLTGQVLTRNEALHETIPALLSLLEALSEDSPFLTLDPPQRRRRTLDALKRIFVRESQVQPLLLVFEDVHWIDTETQAWLDSLVESLSTARILLLVSYRPEYQHDWGSKTYYTPLRLDPLLPASAEEFLKALLGGDPSLEPLKRLLIERTEGNPFFLEESVRALVETGVLVGTPGTYRLVQRLPTIQLPATVLAVLAARIDRLPTEEKQLLQAAAVIGTDVPSPLLQAIAELPEAALHHGLTHLQAAEFLYETRLFPERAYTFTHALTQQVAYQSLLTSTRQQYHQRIAQVLEAQFPEVAETQPELLAHHYTEAGLYEQALPAWQRAGQRATKLSAYVEALAHLTKGLAVLQTLPEAPERARHELAMQTTLGRVLMLTKGHGAPEVERALVRARALGQQLGDTAALVPVQNGLWGMTLARADLRTARTLAEELLRTAQGQQEPVQLSRAHDALGETLCYRGELIAARSHLERCLALYEPPQHHQFGAQYEGPSRGVLGRVFLAKTLWLLGYPHQALVRIHDARTLARQLAHPVSLAMALDFAASLHLLRREVPAVQEQTAALQHLAREQVLPFWEAWAQTLQGWVLARQHQSEMGIRQMWEGLAACQTTGSALDRPWLFGLIAEAYGQHGQVEKGLRVLEDALTRVDTTEERWYEAELYRLQGELLLQHTLPQTQQAETCFHQALDIARHQQARSWELRAVLSLSRLWQHQDKRQEAYELLAPVYSWFTEGFDTADLQEAKALLEELGDATGVHTTR